jgi:hypothetical protein
MKPILNKILLLLSICFIFSCGLNKSSYFDTIIKTKEGHLRGAEIGTTIETVKALEGVTFLDSEMPDYLYYEYELNMGNSYTVTYDFSEENKLYEIELAVYFDVIKDADTLFNDFSNLYNKKYKSGKKEEDGYTTWHTTSSINGNRVEIAIINDSEAYGFITLIIRDLDY